MSKKSTVTMRLPHDHKESFKAWADRLGISLTQLYTILVGQAGPKALNKLVLTEFADKHLQRLGLPHDSIKIMQTSPDAMHLFYFLLSCSAKKEFAELAGDIATAENMTSYMGYAEADLLRAFGAAVKEYYPQSAE